MKYIWLFILITSLPATCTQRLNLKIDVIASKVLTGEPIQLEATINGKNFTLPGPLDLEHNFYGHIEFKITDPSGRPARWGSSRSFTSAFDFIPCASCSMRRYASETVGRRTLFLDPGHYKLQLAYSSKGPFYDLDNWHSKIPVHGIWEGDLLSNEIEIQVDAPTGLDLQAAETCNYGRDRKDSSESPGMRCDALYSSAFASSTYAGWVLRSGGPGMPGGSLNASLLIDNLEKPSKGDTGYPGFLYQPFEDGRNDSGKAIYRNRVEVSARYDELAMLFLKAHPDHPAACLVWAQMAMAKLFQKKWSESLDAIHHANAPVCDRVLTFEFPLAPKGGWAEMKNNLALLEKEINRRGLAK